MTREYELIDGKAYISRQNLAELFNVTPQQVISYEKPQKYPTPLEKVDFKKNRQVYYDLFKAVKWHITFVTTNKEVKSVVQETFENPIINEDVEEVTLDNMSITVPLDTAKEKRARRQREEFEAKLAEIKLLKEKGKLIYKDDCDEGKTMFIKAMLGVMKNIQEKTPLWIREAMPDLKIDSREIEKFLNKQLSKTIDELASELKKKKARKDV